VGKFFFDNEYNHATGTAKALRNFITLCRSPKHDPTKLAANFRQQLDSAKAAIRAIPCDDPGTILPSDSPFQTYLRLRAVSTAASSRLDLLDPYLTADVFHRYLCDVPQSAVLTVVTSEKVMRDVARRDRIVTISELVALERKDKYRFLVTGQQHDRHCRADDEIFHLGGSVAHASIFAPYTLSKLDPTQSNHAFLDSVIAGAMEWYGPTVTTHRKT
jgi:hypothetical protein